MGKTLLLADDSVTIQKVVGISFASEDIAITTVDNGDDAIARTRELRPDVILADVVMPGKSGYEVCETIKSDADLRHIPVLLLTGTFEAFDEERASRAGAAGHIAKPFEAQTLVDRVKQLLAQAPAPAAPAQAPAATPESDSAGADNAFDFFDEPLPEAEATATGHDFEIEEPDAAFAFGDEDLAGPAAGAPPQRPAPAAHTVAILPDEPPPAARTREADGRPAAAAGSLPPVGEAQKPMPPLQPPSSSPAAPTPLPSPGVAAAGEGFDFEFESVDAPPSPPPSATPPPAPEAEGLAESMLLDPAGDSAFDVSSSDLGDLAVPEPEPEPVATRLMDVAPAEPARPAPSAAAARPQPEPELEMLETDPLEDEPVSPAPGFVEEVPTGAPTRAADPMDFAPAPPVATDGAKSTGAARPGTPRDAAAATPSFASAPGPVAIPDEALAQIAPALREQLHETLEKIAWEAFGQVTETVVRQAVESLEKVAWEVVPKLAEALIQEEIRKLKGQ